MSGKGMNEGPTLLEKTFRNARAEQEMGQIVERLAEERNGYDTFATEHGRQPNALERIRIRRELEGEELPPDWEERMTEQLMEIQRREDAGESLSDILASFREGEAAEEGVPHG